MACRSGHEELARLLITKYNCPVDIKNKNKQTPLHKACSSGHCSMIRMLISEFKVDATQRDHIDDTAVSKAAMGGHVETVQALITELGCKVLRQLKVIQTLRSALQLYLNPVVERACVVTWESFHPRGSHFHLRM
jgi:hypothetical protein